MTIPHCDGFAIYVELNRTTKTTTFVSLTVAHVAPRKNDLCDDTGWKRSFRIEVSQERYTVEWQKGRRLILDYTAHLAYIE